MSARELGGPLLEPRVPAESGTILLLACFDFESTTMYVHSGVGEITFDGKTWLGLGSLGSIENVEESSRLSSPKIKLSLSGVLQEHIGSALYEKTFNREVSLWLLYLDEDSLSQNIDTPDEDPILIFRGMMSSPEVVSGIGSSTVRIIAEDFRARLGFKNKKRFTFQDHQEIASGDLFYEFLPQMQDHKFVFNGKDHGGSNRITSPNNPPPDYRNFPHGWQGIRSRLPQ